MAWRRQSGDRVVRWAMPAYVEWYDPDAQLGAGKVGWVTEPAYAKIFQSEADSVKEVERQGVIYPLTRDGKPNKPLADRYVVKIVEVELRDGPGIFPRVREVNNGDESS